MLNPKPRAATGPAEKRRAQRLSIDPAVTDNKRAQMAVDKFSNKNEFIFFENAQALAIRVIQGSGARTQTTGAGGMLRAA